MMKKTITLAIAALLIASGARADVAVVLTDAEKTVLIQMIDAAVRAQGLAAAPNAVALFNKIQAAPVVTARTESDPPGGQR